MEVVLLKDFSSLGDAGDIVNVKPGYARNMLIPQGIALRATNKNLSAMEERKKLNILREKRENLHHEDIAKRLSNLEITIEVQVGEEDKMFGSISSNDIHKSITSKGFEINQDSINLEKPIKALGIYKIDINVTKKIKSTVKVYVIKS
jgi:large subunit ribosomal protein L9